MEDPRLPFVPFTHQQISKMLKDMEAPADDTIIQYCQQIRTWLLTETKYSNRIDDNLIYTFLVGNRFHLKTVKEKIDNYIHLADNHSSFFTDRDPLSSALQLSSTIVNMCILPRPTKDGYRIVYSQIADPGSKAYNIVDSYKRIFAQMDLLLSKDHCCRGYVYILSGKSVGLWHASHWTVSLVKSLFEIIAKSRPEGVVAWYFMDMNMILKPVFTVTLKVLSDESLRKKVHFNDKKNLEAILSKDVLPKQYGGHADYDFNQLNEKWQRYLEQNREFFL
ncbi:hypothetical protein M8J76_000800 [Diaphorina citri]|nr:hypothetical protein M8J76_000800 [Diaphorina citri]